VYAAAKEGWAINCLKTKAREGVADLLDTIETQIPAPNVDVNGEFKMLITQTESNQYFGRSLIGKIESGTLTKDEKMCSVDQDGDHVENGRA